MATSLIARSHHGHSRRNPGEGEDQDADQGAITKSDDLWRAFYYVRVIEIPTPRWTAYDAKYYGTKSMPGTPMVVTERAYTSPIWYTP